MRVRLKTLAARAVALASPCVSFQAAPACTPTHTPHPFSFLSLPACDPARDCMASCRGRSDCRALSASVPAAAAQPSALLPSPAGPSSSRQQPTPAQSSATFQSLGVSAMPPPTAAAPLGEARRIDRLLTEAAMQEAQWNAMEPFSAAPHRSCRAVEVRPSQEAVTTPAGAASEAGGRAAPPVAHAAPSAASVSGASPSFCFEAAWKARATGDYHSAIRVLSRGLRLHPVSLRLAGCSGRGVPASFPSCFTHHGPSRASPVSSSRGTCRLIIDC